jgi:NAD(P)-dependent dehydrogenase (short-subunit alcohol dehydrogenase family)
MLQGKKSIVTGAAMGIGKQVALSYAKHGSDVMVFDIKDELAAQTVEEIRKIGKQADFIHVDVRDRKNIREAVVKTHGKWGRIDTLANCAGVNKAGKILEMEDQNFDMMMDINLKGTLYMMQETAAYMKEKNYGRIVNIASMVGKMPEAGNGGYCISKAGVIMLTQVSGLEFAKYGITVNAVCPGYVDTALMKEVFEKRGPLLGLTPEAYKTQILGTIPSGRMASPAEISDLMAFLASDMAGYITGIAITIAGGVWFY